MKFETKRDIIRTGTEKVCRAIIRHGKFTKPQLKQILEEDSKGELIGDIMDKGILPGEAFIEKCMKIPIKDFRSKLIETHNLSLKDQVKLASAQKGNDRAWEAIWNKSRHQIWNLPVEERIEMLIESESTKLENFLFPKSHPIEELSLKFYLDEFGEEQILEIKDELAKTKRDSLLRFKAYIATHHHLPGRKKFKFARIFDCKPVWKDVLNLGGVVWKNVGPVEFSEIVRFSKTPYARKEIIKNAGFEFEALIELYYSHELIGRDEEKELILEQLEKLS